MGINQQTELLAPAGDIEAGYAAFYYGADAVYLGLPKFSARAEATNFTPEELDEFVAYAHANNKKVYVALNTLVQERELPEVMNSLETCVKMKVDAVIVQDLGIARIIRMSFPELDLHASTQMAIHNLEGALVLKKMGFTRVVLARELSLNEIQKIQKESGLEIEVFIHGALCYSYSGLCLFSSFQTARSANRGKCVYSCRDTFKIGDKQTHPFSMKDMALEEEILKLRGLSLKIEGRKKTPLYVAAVTDYYRRILDTGKVDASLSDNLKQIFARPWTKLHLKGKNKEVIDTEFVGHRGLKIGKVEKLFNHTITFKPTHAIEKYDGIQIDVDGIAKPFGFSAEELVVNGKHVFQVSPGKSVEITLPPHHPFIHKGAPIYLASSGKVKSSYPYEKPKPGAYKNRIPLDVAIFVSQDKVVAIAADIAVESNGFFTPAQNIQNVTNGIHFAFAKTGDTPFELKELQIHNPDKLFVPVSLLNELRRDLYSRIHVQEQTRPMPVLPVLKPVKNQSCKWLIKTDDVANLAKINLDECDEIIVLVDAQFNAKVLDRLPKNKVRLSLPPVIRSTEKYKKLITSLCGRGYDKWEIGNLSGLGLLPANTDISFDYFISILNEQALAHAMEMGASRVTISPEDTLDNIKKLTTICDKICVPLYQDTPLFLSANCVRENDCADCSNQEWDTTITNGNGQFELISRNCETTVVPKNPLCWANEQSDIGSHIYRVDLCYKKYTPTLAATIWNTVRAGNDIKGTCKFNLKKQFA